MTDNHAPSSNFTEQPASNADASQSNCKDASFDQILAIWSKAVDTQMHFNQLSVKSRQLGLTFVVSTLGLATVLFRLDDAARFYILSIPWIGKLHVSVLLIIAAIVAMYLVRLLDLNVYHQMLRGAVAFGEDLENSKIVKQIGTSKGMTQAISFFSRNPDAAFFKDKKCEERYVQSAQAGRTKNARKKIEFFYKVSMLVLGLAAISLFIATRIPPSVLAEH